MSRTIAFGRDILNAPDVDIEVYHKKIPLFRFKCDINIDKFP